jgi:hypothetical protein
VEPDCPKFALVVPTLNEAGNIEPLLNELVTALRLSSLAWEILVVDDESSDGHSRHSQALCGVGITRAPFGACRTTRIGGRHHVRMGARQQQDESDDKTPELDSSRWREQADCRGESAEQRDEAAWLADA